ncbi:MAG TPA: D-glycero-beta-D-manno-heptose-7-phosphate kinase [archaeon]|nr:D-glycero-beta-D-manno-heptose-7-phosphate kinase [archaeon]
MDVSLFAGRKVLVIGDVMLDRYLHGDVTRISPEAPVPVVRVERESFVPGGAANTANNIVSLGGVAHVISVVGADSSGSLLLREMEKSGIDTSGILRDSSRPTIEKTRVLGQTHQMLRLDYESVDSVGASVESNIIKNIERAVPLVDIVVISDYGKGVVTENMLQFLYDACERNGKDIIVDPKPKNAKFFTNVFLVTPNEKEAMEITGEEDVEKCAESLSHMLSANILITRGEKGMFLYEKNRRKAFIPTQAMEVFDVSGAGDTVVATLALCIAAGMEIEDAAVAANQAAGIVVGKMGTSVVTPDELIRGSKSAVSRPLQESIDVMRAVAENEMPSIERLAELMIGTYRNGKKILVFGNGGSASDAQHFVGELVGRFKRERAGLPAVSLNSDTTILTAISNDFGYSSVFERQVEALASQGDLVVGITTSGNSENVLKGLTKAKYMGARTACLTGRTGGKAAGICDVEIRVPSDNTPRIQESHTAIIHVACEMMENELYGTASA